MYARFCERFRVRLPGSTRHRDGFVLWYKRLQAGVFKLPRLAPGTRSVELKASELAMLLDGIDLSKLKRTPRYQLPSTAAQIYEPSLSLSGNAVRLPNA